MAIVRMTDLDLHGKRVLIREDLNVPIKDGVITSEQRIKAALPTLKLALAKGAGAESRTQIGWVIVGGMSLGTLLAIFVVPTMYSLLARKSVPGPNKAVAHESPPETAVH